MIKSQNLVLLAFLVFSVNNSFAGSLGDINGKTYEQSIADADACVRSGGKTNATGGACAGGGLKDQDKTNIEAVNKATGKSEQELLNGAADLLKGLKAKCPADETQNALCLNEKITAITEAAMRAQAAAGSGPDAQAKLDKFIKTNAKGDGDTLTEAMRLSGLKINELSMANP